MTSTNSLPQNPEVVAAIERAFQDVWAVLYAHLPLDGGDAVKEQSIALSQTLVALAADGITDPRELRRKALEAMVLTPRQPGGSFGKSPRPVLLDECPHLQLRASKPKREQQRIANMTAKLLAATESDDADGFRP